MTQQYFSRRGTLVDILLLVDASLPPKDTVRRQRVLRVTTPHVAHLPTCTFNRVFGNNTSDM
jgi:hypothetical protein